MILAGECVNLNLHLCMCKKINQSGRGFKGGTKVFVEMSINMGQRKPLADVQVTNITVL